MRAREGRVANPSQSLKEQFGAPKQYPKDWIDYMIAESKRVKNG